MKAILLSIVLFLVIIDVSAQSTLVIKLTKNGVNIEAAISPSQKNEDGDYPFTLTSSSSIHIICSFAVANLPIKIVNSSGSADPSSRNVFNTKKSFAVNDSLIIEFDTSKKVTTGGTGGNAVTNKFMIKIDKLSISVVLQSNVSKKIVETSLYQPTGIPFQDAMTLYSVYKNAQFSMDTIFRILSYYTKKGEIKDSLITWKEAESNAAFSNNQFIKDFIKIAKSKDPTANGPGAQSAGTVGSATMLSSAVSSLGGLDVTTIADGFAKFIVKRTKQELSVAFFEKFRTQLNKAKDLKSVFPQTYKALNAIGDEIYNYEAYLLTIRESFEKDLATLPANLPTIIKNHEDFFDKLPELKAILLSGFYIAQQIQDKQHPGNIIENYPVEFVDDAGINANIKASFETFKLLSTSLKSNTEADRYWSSYSDIKKLFDPNDDMLLKIYLGLIEQQAKLENISFKNDAGVVTELSKVIDGSFGIVGDIALYKIYIKNLVLKIQALEVKISGLKTTSGDSLKFENYYNFVSSTIEIMKYLTQVENLPRFPQNLKLQEKTEKYFYTAQTACDVVIDVNRRNYSSAIVNVTQLYDTIFSKTNTKSYVEKAFVPAAGLTPEVITKQKVDSTTREQNRNSNTLSALFKYGSLMSSIVTAKTSDEVEQAIEAIALPVGSARVKRQTNFNVSINAYCGLFVGNEIIKGAESDKPFHKFPNAFGVTAPIGISISRGRDGFLPFFDCRDKRKHNWSHSLFVSLVDLGAIAAYRFTDETTTQVPTIQLKNIFSPGLFWSTGVAKTPLSINLGAQVGPNLRKVKVTPATPASNDYSGNTYMRYSLSVCVDLPLLNLYTKSN